MHMTVASTVLTRYDIFWTRLPCSRFQPLSHAKSRSLSLCLLCVCCFPSFLLSHWCFSSLHQGQEEHLSTIIRESPIVADSGRWYGNELLDFVCATWLLSRLSPRSFGSLAACGTLWWLSQNVSLAQINTKRPSLMCQWQKRLWLSQRRRNMPKSDYWHKTLEDCERMLPTMWIWTNRCARIWKRRCLLRILLSEFGELQAHRAYNRKAFLLTEFSSMKSSAFYAYIGCW